MLYKTEAYRIIGAAFEVHNYLGMGFTEYVYQDALEVELQKSDIPYEREKHLNVVYKDVCLKHDYFVDFLCYGEIIVELKAVKELTNEHRVQVINYLKSSKKQLAILFNFGEKPLHYERLVLTTK